MCLFSFMTGVSVPAFDCCFHPEILRIMREKKQFQELLVKTAIEGVEQSYKNQGQEVSQ